jgi:hypothetical protein
MAKPTQQNNDPNRKSLFAQAIDERKASRVVEGFDVSGLFGLADKPIPHIGCRVPTKGEQDRAIIAAHKYIAEIAANAGAGAESAKADRDLTQDAKTAAAIFECFREMVPDPDDPKKWIHADWPAFPSHRWAIENLTPEQIAVLLNLANEFRAKQAPSPIGLDEDTVEDYIAVCVNAENPEYLLVGLSREYLVQLQILTSHQVKASRNEVTRLADELALLKARLGVDEDITITVDGWTGAGIRYTPPDSAAEAAVGATQRYVIGCQDPDGFMHYGPRVGAFLAVLDHAPSAAEIRAVLDAAIAGDVDTMGLLSLSPATESVE